MKKKILPLLDGGWSEFIHVCKDVDIDRPCGMVTIDVDVSS